MLPPYEVPKGVRDPGEVRFGEARAYAEDEGRDHEAVGASERPHYADRGRLLATMLEARTLLERFYPDAVYLGRPAKVAAGAGTPEEVLAALPTAERSGASMLHLGCHARTGASPASAHLGLAGRPLSVTRVLRQAHNRAAEAPGGLVVLAACTSDLTDRDHDDVLAWAGFTHHGQ